MGLNLGPSYGSGGAADALTDLMKQRFLEKQWSDRMAMERAQEARLQQQADDERQMKAREVSIANVAAQNGTNAADIPWDQAEGANGGSPALDIVDTTRPIPGTSIYMPSEQATNRFKAVQVPGAYGAAPGLFRARTAEEIRAQKRADLLDKVNTEGVTLGSGDMRVVGPNVVAYNPKEPNHSAVYNEWRDAVAEGYPGSLEQYMKDDANRKRPAPVDPNKGQDRLERYWTRYSAQLDALGKPARDQAERLSRLQASIDEGTPQADSLVAPELLTAMAGGMGSGLRMNEAEIARIVGGRSNWETLHATLNKWAVDPKSANSITPSQRQQIRSLIGVVSAKVKSKLDAVDRAHDRLMDAQDPMAMRDVLSHARKVYDAVSFGQYMRRERPDAPGQYGESFDGGKTWKVE